MVLEVEYWKSVLLGIISPGVPIIPYIPAHRKLPSRVLTAESAWRGIESVLEDLIQTFKIDTRRCLEFGVEFGYSTVALSSFFESVVGVDMFVGDKHTTNKQDIFSETLERLSVFKNIQLVRSDYRDWIMRDDTAYDLIHVDIVHTYIDTFNCGLWSVEHAKCVLFHDTLSFPTVKQAVTDIARKTDRRFYNFGESHGLGILV